MKLTLESILVFGLPKENAALLEAAMIPLKVRVRWIPPENFSASIGELVSGTAQNGTSSLSLPEPVLILNGLSSRKMDQVLQQLRDPSLPQIGLKAAVTPTNSKMDIFTLYEELCKERAAFQGK